MSWNNYKGMSANLDFEKAFLPEQQKSPQVLAHLAGGIEITSDISISQNQLITMLCDGDAATKDAEIGILRRWFYLGDLERWPNDESQMPMRT